MHRTLWFIALVLAASATAFAQITPRVEVRDTTLVVNREIAIRVRMANGDLTPERRVQIAAERLRNAVARRLGAVQVGTRTERRRAAVTIDGEVLLYATRADARAAGTTPARLASIWASSLRHCLAIPPIRLSATELLVPLGEARTVRVNSWLDGTLVVAPTGAPNEGVADPAVTGDGRTLRIVGRALGTERVLVSLGEVTVSLTVSVKKYAGQVNLLEPVVVTGVDLPVDFVRQVVQSAVRHRTELEPGAQIEFTTPVQISRVPDFGESTTASVRVRLSGSAYIPRDEVLRVTVVNRPQPPTEPVLLMVSNDPERVQRAQTLFTGDIEDSRGCRLLYHHMNGMPEEGLLLIELLNPSNASRSVHLSGAASAPMRDTVRVGFIAGELFLKAMLNGMGQMLTVPPQSKIVLLAQRLRPLDTASGILQIRPISTEQSPSTPPLAVKVAMHSFQNQPLPLLGTTMAWGVSPARPLTPQETQQLTHNDHIYPTSHKVLEATYVVGQRWQFIRIGERAVPNHNEQRRLAGNYGVLYEVRVEIVNPTDKVRDVEIAFEPSAGEAGGVFAIGGEVRGVPRLFPPREFAITRIRLQPGQRRNLTLRTIPLAGSNYPVTLMVRS